tara:strand:- start:116 stop:2230 length:2115 start_codon:yes stop_codon:yes gene_type:complete
VKYKKNLGVSNQKSGFGDKAKRIKKKPIYTDQELENIKLEGLKMYQKNRFDKALIAFKKIIKFGNNDPEVFANLYQIYKKQLRINDTFIIYKRIIKDNTINYSEITIDFLNFILNLGKEEFANQLVFESFKDSRSNEKVILFYSKILIDKNITNLALNLLKKALDNNPSSISILSNIGYIFQSLKQHKEAIKYYKLALNLNPEDYLVLFNIANCYEENLNWELAIDFYKQSLKKNGNNPEANRALGSIYANLEEYNLAKLYLQECLSRDNKNTGALITLMKLSADICEWKAVKKCFKEINSQKLTKNISPFAFLSIEDNPINHLKRAKIASNQRFKKTTIELKTFTNKKKRIGYFSSDFYNHATMHLMQKVFELHDKTSFEIFIYSYGRYQDEVTEKLKNNVYIFRDVSLLTDEEIVLQARNDRLDVAIDLKGFTRETRLSIFAERVSKIQISYLGYPGSIGAEFMDYLIADRTLIPQEYEKFYSEKIIYMPDSYQCNDNTKVIANIKLNRKDFDLPEEAVIFTCFNAAFKITESEFNIWMLLLKEVENSHLWLLGSNIFMEKNLRNEATKRGIDHRRLIFAKKLPLDKHLARHSLGDIFLDTFNYNAHTTASDALWAGMPLVTLAGKSFSARVSASLLNSIGLSELICSTEKQYFEKALELGRNPRKISFLKQKLFNHKYSYPLFDSHLFIKNYESKLKEIIN